MKYINISFTNEMEKISFVNQCEQDFEKRLCEVSRRVKDAGAEIAGAGIIIEKAYQGGGDYIRNEMGVRVDSLAKIASMSVEGGIEFC